MNKSLILLLTFLGVILTACSSDDNNSDEDNDDNGPNTTKLFSRAFVYDQSELDFRFEFTYDAQLRISSIVYEDYGFDKDSIIFNYPDNNSLRVSNLVGYHFNVFSDDYRSTYNYTYNTNAINVNVDAFNLTTNEVEASSNNYTIAYTNDYVTSLNAFSVASNEMSYEQTFEYNADQNITKFTFTNHQSNSSNTYDYVILDWDQNKVRDPLNGTPDGFENAFLLYGANLETSKSNPIEFSIYQEFETFGPFNVELQYDENGHIIKNDAVDYIYLEI